MFCWRIIALQYCVGLFFQLIYLFWLRIIKILWWHLPYININWLQYTCDPSYWTPLPLLPPPYPSGLSQSTSFGCPASCIKLALVICFTYCNLHISVLFSQIIPPSPFPTESVQESVLYICVSFAVSHIGYHYHLSKFQSFGLHGRRQGWDDLRE